MTAHDSDSAPVRVTTQGDGIVRLRLERAQARNAVNLEMCHALSAACESIASDPQARVVLIEAAGPVFCAGADLKERRGRAPAWIAARRRASFAAYAAIEAQPVPVIAVIDGPVIGGGGEIVMAADFAIASSNARFRWPEAHWGTVGATQRLPRVIGKARAKELLFTGREIDAREAWQLGLVAQICAPEEIAQRAEATAQAIAQAPALSMRLTKQCVDLGTNTDLAHGIDLELLAIDRNLAGDEWAKGLEAFEHEHRSRRTE